MFKCKNLFKSPQRKSELTFTLKVTLCTLSSVFLNQQPEVVTRKSLIMSFSFKYKNNINKKYTTFKATYQQYYFNI